MTDYAEFRESFAVPLATVGQAECCSLRPIDTCHLCANNSNARTLFDYSDRETRAGFTPSMLGFASNLAVK
jgi:hypothetical protein